MNDQTARVQENLSTRNNKETLRKINNIDLKNIRVTLGKQKRKHMTKNVKRFQISV